MFVCECGKKYKQKGWYTKHLLTHKVAAVTRDGLTHSAPSSLIDQPTTSTSVSSAPSTNEDAFKTPNGDSQHCEEHGTADEIAAAANLTWDDWSGTDDDEEVETYYHLDTEPWREDEEEERRRTQQAGAAEVNLDPPTKKNTPPPSVKCTSCSATFTTFDGYFKHRMTHGMQAALLNLPSLDDIVNESPRIASEVLIDLQSSKLKFGFVQGIKDIASEMKKHLEGEEMKSFFQVLCGRLYNFTQTETVHSTPTAFVNIYFTNSSAAMVDVPMWASLLEVIVKVIQAVECNACRKCSLDCNGLCSKLYSNFLTSFAHKFSDKLLAHVLHVIRERNSGDHVRLEERYAVTSQSTRSIEFKQDMHFIGGSNVKSFLKNALRVKHRNEEWQRVISTVRENFIINEFANAPDKELMAWTETVDRGKLTKISDKALEFFVQLGTEVKPLERLDGSVVNDEVFQKISNCPPLLLKWDELKGKLSERESFKLLHAICMHFCVTWRNGIIGRRNDELAAQKGAQKFGTSGVAFRSKLGAKTSSE